MTSSPLLVTTGKGQNCIENSIKKDLSSELFAIKRLFTVRRNSKEYLKDLSPIEYIRKYFTKRVEFLKNTSRSMREI